MYFSGDARTTVGMCTGAFMCLDTICLWHLAQDTESRTLCQKIIHFSRTFVHGSPERTAEVSINSVYPSNSQHGTSVEQSTVDR